VNKEFRLPDVGEGLTEADYIVSGNVKGGHRLPGDDQPDHRGIETAGKAILSS